MGRPSGNGASVKRSRKSRAIEFALWAGLSVAVALTLILLSDRILAPNF